VRYAERKEFLFDSELWKKTDVGIALKMHAEYVRTSSPRPYPKFFEVDRSEEAVDPLWHMPMTERTVFKRTLDIPSIVTFEKPNWAMTKLGLTPKQHFKFWLANLHLNPSGTLIDGREIDPVRLDYFPLRGDLIYYIGYRLMVINVVLDPSTYWLQTNVWLGLVCEASIAPDGDARPTIDLLTPVPAEQPGAKPLPDWPGPAPTGPANIPHNWP
jgi:hypothetical protein